MRAVLVGLALSTAFLAEPAAAQVRLPAYQPNLSSTEYTEAEMAQTLRDQISCREQAARESKVTPIFMSVPGGSLVGAVIVGAATGVATGLMESNRGASAIKACMTGLGYMPRDLSPAEQAELKAVSSADRRKWFDKTALWAPRPGSQSYALMMWDVQMNRPVAVRRDPLTGQVSRSWSTAR